MHYLPYDFKMKSDEYDETIKHAIPQESDIDLKIPELAPRRTVLFTAISNKSLLHILNTPFFRLKIRNECQWLIDHGYYVFVVSYGNAYGMIALKELIKLKQEGISFCLYSGKVRGERGRFRRNMVKQLRLLCQCDRCFGSQRLEDFFRKVICQVTIISSEKSLFYTNQKVPRSLVEYYYKTMPSFEMGKGNGAKT